MTDADTAKVLEVILNLSDSFYIPMMLDDLAEKFPGNELIAKVKAERHKSRMDGED